MLPRANEQGLPFLKHHEAELLLQLLQQAEASQQTAPGLDQQSPGILVMVAQPPYHLSLEEASKLTIPAFSALWTVSLDMPLH